MMWAMPITHEEEGGEEESELEPRTPEHPACSPPLYKFLWGYPPFPIPLAEVGTRGWRLRLCAKSFQFV